MADKIQVAVRVRPVLFQKKDVEIHWACEKGTVVQLDPVTRKRLGNPYPFDQVFSTETQNYQIFTELVQPLIDSAMNGFNVTVLAYGQTASGKTYTMMGSQKELGIVQLAVERMFNSIEKNPERAFLLRCSYIEIYNESISDLLSSNHQKLKVQELAEGHVVVHNLLEMNVNTPDAVLKLMQQGNKQRKVGGTSMNERSSRSHTIFRIIVESVPRDEADRSDAAVIVSHINLVDLAGSEKASQTNATGDRFREGCAINTSLSALSLVIKQLSEGEGFVNFRDSKLTHILRASLGGNARTAIICNVTPTVLEETSSTLKFASSAKTVQNQPHVNEVLSDQALLRKYNNYIKDLEKKLKEKELEKKPEAIEEMQRLLQEKDMKIHELKEQLVVSSCNPAVLGEDHITTTQRSLRRMTWGGSRLKQINFPPPAAFETPLLRSIANRARLGNFSNSEMALDETDDSIESEAFLPAEMVFTKPTEQVTKVDAATMTETGESPFRKPGTPVPVLRERMTHLRKTLMDKEKENNDLKEELEDLASFTRLEEQIGVHAQATARISTSVESGDQLHQALQTANDMEVLYLDTQRKLSDLQTEFRAKMEEKENEIETQQIDFQQRLELESSEKKLLMKELAVLKDKHDRLERDHGESDIHVQVISERYAKREADLRQTLQEAWTQLERLGQDPKAIQESSGAKKQLAVVEEELLEMRKCNLEAQCRIDELTAELQRTKESCELRERNITAKIDELTEELRQAKENAEAADKELEDQQKLNMAAQFRINELAEELREAKEIGQQFSETKLHEQELVLEAQSREEEMRQAKEVAQQSSLELLYLQERRVQAQTQIDELNKELRQSKEIAQQFSEASAKQLEECKKAAQAQIDELIEELRQAKEAAQQFSNAVIEKEDQKELPMETEELLELKKHIIEAQCRIEELKEELRQARESAQQTSQSTETEASLDEIELLELRKRNQEAQNVIDSLTEELRLAKEALPKYNQLDNSLDGMCLADELRDIVMDQDYSFAARSSVRPRKRPSSILSVALAKMDQSASMVDAFEQEPIKKTRMSIVQPEDADFAEVKEIREHLVELQVVLAQYEADFERIRKEKDILGEQLLSSQNEVAKLLVDEKKPSRRLTMKVDTEAFDSSCLMGEASFSASLMEMDEEDEVSFSDETTRLKQELVQKGEQILRLQENMDNKNSELDELRRTLENTKSAVESLENEKERLNDELQQSSFEGSQLKEATEKLSAQVDHLEAEMARQEKDLGELHVLREQLEQLKSTLEDNRKAYELLTSQLSDEEELRNTLESEKLTLLGKLQHLESDFQLRQQEISELRGLQGDLREVEAQKSAMSDRIQQLEAQFESEKTALLGKLHQLENDMKLREQEVTELRGLQGDLREVELQKSAMSERVQQIEAQFESEKMILLGKLQHLEGDVKLREREISELRNSQGDQREVELQKSAMSDRIQQLEAQLVPLQQELANSKILQDQLRSTLADLQSANDRLASRLMDEEDTKAKLCQELESNSQKLDALRSKIEAVETEKSAMSDQLELLGCELKNRDEEIAELHAIRHDLRNNTEQLESTAKQLDALQSKLADSENEKTFLSNRIEELERQLSIRQQETGELQNKALYNERELSAQLKRRLNALEADHESAVSLCDSLRLARDELLECQGRMMQENQQLKSQFQSAIEAKLALAQLEFQSAAQKDALLQDYQHLKESFSDVENQLRVARSQRDENLSQAKLLAEQISELKAKTIALESSSSRQAELEETIETLRKGLNEAKSNSELLLSNFEAVKFNSKKEIEQYENELIIARQQSENVCQDYVRLKTNLVEMERKLDAVNSERNQYAMQARSLLDQVNELKEKVSAFEAQSKFQTQLEEVIERLKQELVDTKSSSEFMRSNFETVKDHSSKQLARYEQEFECLKQQHGALLQDYELLKDSLEGKENQLQSIQSHRDELVAQVKLLGDQMNDWRAKANTLESGSRHQSQRQLEDMVEALKRELVNARSSNEILRLNFETEEENRKKKIERLEKDLESMKQQYNKCKEQLRLSRYKVDEEGTVNFPKSRAVSTESTQMQTDPIADKGFGFRWQMEQYVSDNERLRKKVSEVGERMEHYKERLIKYRSLYFEATGKDPNQRPSSSAGSLQPERPSSTARENTAENRGKSVTPAAAPTVAQMATSQEHQDGGKATAPAPTRWSGVKKESLTKEEMEKINNCNPS